MQKLIAKTKKLYAIHASCIGGLCLLQAVFNLATGQRPRPDIDIREFKARSRATVKQQGFVIKSSEGYFTTPQFHEFDHATMGFNCVATRHDSTFNIRILRMPGTTPSGCKDTMTLLQYKAPGT